MAPKLLAVVVKPLQCAERKKQSIIGPHTAHTRCANGLFACPFCWRKCPPPSVVKVATYTQFHAFKDVNWVEYKREISKRPHGMQHSIRLRHQKLKGFFSQTRMSLRRENMINNQRPSRYLQIAHEIHDNMFHTLVNPSTVWQTYQLSSWERERNIGKAWHPKSIQLR